MSTTGPQPEDVRCFNGYPGCAGAAAVHRGIAVKTQLFCTACYDACGNNDSAYHRCKVCHDYTQREVYYSDDSEVGYERVRADPVVPGGPRVPAAYSSSNDVNPICGCHLRAQCAGCSGCTTCDGCYCYEA